MWWFDNLFHLCILANFEKSEELHSEGATHTGTAIRSIVRSQLSCFDFDEEKDLKKLSLQLPVH